VMIQLNTSIRCSLAPEIEVECRCGAPGDGASATRAPRGMASGGRSCRFGHHVQLQARVGGDLAQEGADSFAV